MQEEKLMQLPGHLRGRALQVWKLSILVEGATYQIAIKALREHLDTGDQALAALDFCHTSQRLSKTVPDYVRCQKEYFK